MDSLFLGIYLAIFLSLTSLSLPLSLPSPSLFTISLFPALAIPASSRTHNPAHLVHISFIPSSCFLLPSDSVSNPQLRLRSCSSFLQFFGYFGTLRTSFPLRCNWRINLPACFSLLSLFPIPVCAFCLSCFSQGIPGAEKRRTGFGFGIGSGTLLLQYSCNNFNFNFNIYFLGPRSGPSDHRRVRYSNCLPWQSNTVISHFLVSVSPAHSSFLVVASSAPPSARFLVFSTH